MPIESDKTDFLIYELGLLSLKAALSTRTEGWPVYAKSHKEHQRKLIKDGFRRVLGEVLDNYTGKPVGETEHVKYIRDLANSFSREHGTALYKSRLRFGVAQKLVNIHLKYLWAAGLCPEPPHCPLDGIVRDIAGLEYDWTTSDSEAEYTSAIEALRLTAGTRSLSVWELQEFRRREQRAA